MKTGQKFMAFASSALLVAEFGVGAFAATTDKSGFENMPAYNIAIIDEKNFNLAEAEITSTNPLLKYVPKIQANAGSEQIEVRGLVYDSAIANGDSVNVDGSITAVWKDRAEDEWGKKYDVSLTLSEMIIKNNHNISRQSFPVALQSGENRLELSANYQTQDTKATVKILDGKTKQPIKGRLLMEFRDLDQRDLALDRYSTDSTNVAPAPHVEHIEFIDEPQSPVFITTDSYLHTNSKAVWGSQVTVSPKDDHSKARIIFDTDFSFYWFGEYCGTQIFTTPDKYTITSSAGEGGNITPSSSAYWKGERKYQTEAKTGYYVKSVQIDGKEVSIKSGSKDYTHDFNGIVANHTIHADFEKQPPVTLEKTTPDAEAKIGDEVSYTLTVKNTGDIAAVNYELEDELDSELEYISDNAEGKNEESKIYWNLNLDAGESKTITIKAKIKAEAKDKVVNKAVVYNTDHEIVAEDDADTAIKVENPKTADNIGIITIASISVMALFGFVLHSSKRRA